MRFGRSGEMFMGETVVDGGTGISVEGGVEMAGVPLSMFFIQGMIETIVLFPGGGRGGAGGGELYWETSDKRYFTNLS